MERTKEKSCQNCGETTVHHLSTYCGAWICGVCGEHHGLVRCYCGWSASGGNGRQELVEAGETIDPDPDDYPEPDYAEGW